MQIKIKSVQIRVNRYLLIYLKKIPKKKNSQTKIIMKIGAIIAIRQPTFAHDS